MTKELHQYIEYDDKGYSCCACEETFERDINKALNHAEEHKINGE